MPNVILPNLGIELPDVGSDQDTWGNILNADLQILDNAVQYDVISKTLAGVDVTLTDVEAASAVINLTGTLTANVNLIVPATPVRVYLVRNQTSGAFTVTVKTAAGTGTPVQQGTSSLVYSDGTNIIQGATSVNGSFSAGNTSVVNLSYTGTLTGGTGAVNIGSGQVSKDANGNVAIANAAPSAWVTFKGLDLNTYGAVAASTSATTFAANCFFNGTNWIYKQNGPASRTELINGQWVVFTAPSGIAGNPITFNQAMTLTQAGNLLVGTTTDVGAKIAVDHAIALVGPGAAKPASLLYGIYLKNGIGTVVESAASTTFNIADAEAARITSARYFKASNTGTYVNSAGAFHEVNGADSAETFFINTTSTTAIASHTRLPVGSTGFHYIGELAASGTVYQVLANGNVQNTNNSYGAISDAKLKNLIGPAPSYWERYKLIEWVKFIFKNDPNNQEQLGVIAQQVRGIFPGLIEETPDMHEVTKTREVTKTVPVTTTETQTTERTEIVLVNGKYVQVTTVTPTEVQVPVIDEFPVYDESGQPVIQLVSPAVEAQDAVLDDEGNELQPAVAAQDAVYAPLMHKVPRMQTIAETETYTEMEPTGTVTLSVKYSILGHISDVVLQEAMARIEALEAR